MIGGRAGAVSDPCLMLMQEKSFCSSLLDPGSAIAALRSTFAGSVGLKEREVVVACKEYQSRLMVFGPSDDPNTIALLF